MGGSYLIELRSFAHVTRLLVMVFLVAWLVWSRGRRAASGTFGPGSAGLAPGRARPVPAHGPKVAALFLCGGAAAFGLLFGILGMNRALNLSLAFAGACALAAVILGAVEGFQLGKRDVDEGRGQDR